ncbi:HNH endonuclease [Planctomicrobium sp. SH527]|uniref:HNH endonuclease n=1 Tax=Planctomicrobium sp. SH527 TaxID=3448123 RepID=UPI003F5BE4F5
MTPIHQSTGPKGTNDYSSMKPWLRDEFCFCCVYCLDRETFRPDGADSIAVEHSEPKSQAPGKEVDYDNVFYSCNRCNIMKGTKYLPSPSSIGLGSMIECREDGTYQAKTAEGHTFIDVLDLNDPQRVEYRRRLLVLCRISTEMPDHAELQEVVMSLRKYPDDLPDLSRLRPPLGNTRPGGVLTSHFARKHNGVLPDVY